MGSAASRSEGLVEDPDPQVIERARAGDLEAFADIVRHYQADAWRLCYGLLRDGAAADDVTQDAFLRLYRFLGRYGGRARFSTWFFQIVRNCALDEIRRAGRRRRIVEAVGNDPIETTTAAPHRIEVSEALAELPLDLREPIIWIDMFGLSYREVADLLKVPIGTIKSRVHRGRELLAGSLGAGDEEAVDGDA